MYPLKLVLQQCNKSTEEIKEDNPHSVTTSQDNPFVQGYVCPLKWVDYGMLNVDVRAIGELRWVLGYGHL